MKQITYLIATLALLLGVASCQSNSPDVSPTNISVEPKSITMHVGDTQALQVSYEPKDVTFAISYESQSPEIATVTKQGVVQAVKEGQTSIIVHVGDKQATCPVSVVAKEAPVETVLTITTPEITVQKGEKATIGYTVTPQETTVTFESDTPEVATVSETGEVTGLLMGYATITLKANDKSATCTVIVEDDPANIKQEMPLLKFSAKYNKELHITDPEVLAYEKALGRTEQGIDFTNHQNFLGFVNTNLTTITGVLYGLRAKGVADYIVGYSKENLDECPRTKAMLNKLGFKDFKETVVAVDDRQEKALVAVCDNDPEVSVTIYNDPNPKLKSILYVQFAKQLPPDPIQTKHAILTDVKDFPSVTDFATLDPGKIKAFESNLGLRTYDDQKSATGTTLYFNTKEDMIAKSNIEYVSYLLEPPLFPPVFISCRLLCVGSQDDLESEELKSYLKANGFDQNYKITEYKEVEVYNAQGDQCVVAIRDYENPPICVMTITLKKDLQSKSRAKRAMHSYPRIAQCVR
ncbi:Ig-like domain-containing protein [Porphyromonas asaccharolytica]